MNQARLNELMNYFEYAEKFTLDDFVNIQVPSLYFPTKGSVVDTLDTAFEQGLVVYDSNTKLYSKA